MINETVLTEQMVEERNHVQFKCYHHDRGYCKFGEQCHYQHFREICQNRNCKLKECRKRHPKPCRNGHQCKFYRSNICAFKHDNEDSTDMENEIKKLQEEIDALKKKIEQKKEELIEANVSYAVKLSAI